MTAGERLERWKLATSRTVNRKRRKGFRRAWKRYAPTMSLKDWARRIADQPLTPWAAYAGRWLQRKGAR